ncbi:MAG TPA: YdcF family protein [Bryobacteraceae bacterium]|nr:YdcF family protein [Bryobacteraceae bacterium]
MVRRPFRSPFFIFLALALAVWASYGLWLPWFGRVLVHDDGPAKADIAVVLAGDDSGGRILKGAELVREGYVPLALISGPQYFDIHESDVAMAFAGRRGYPLQWFLPFPNSTHSTREEAALILAELERRGVRHFILVTSDYHSARARRIWMAALSKGGPDMRVVSAPDEFFRKDRWWLNRESQKTVFFEWAKTIATALGH